MKSPMADIFCVELPRTFVFECFFLDISILGVAF